MEEIGLVEEDAQVWLEHKNIDEDNYEKIPNKKGEECYLDISNTTIYELKNIKGKKRK
ncbi:hypothetical protein Ddye_020223 [Dipteronia dyeriana]|uniref:Uncharacterized protein n=1 Tax=Dipteronia dyeriana TaxID=168575 RepID=A0AAD9TZS5_9ROSI|nr:hypothetical protein Ddye_020223 [Dipteronia dyeriana]